MYCRYCGAELKDDENICTNCWQPDEGDPVPRSTSVKTCKKCGAVLKIGATFCGKCGEEASVNSTAKVTAVAVQPSTTPSTLQPAPANICKKCGATLKEGAVFCGKCAASIHPLIPTRSSEPTHVPTPKDELTTQNAERNRPAFIESLSKTVNDKIVDKDRAKRLLCIALVIGLCMTAIGLVGKVLFTGVASSIKNEITGSSSEDDFLTNALVNSTSSFAVDFVVGIVKNDPTAINNLFKTTGSLMGDEYGLGTLLAPVIGQELISEGQKMLKEEAGVLWPLLLVMVYFQEVLTIGFIAAIGAAILLYLLGFRKEDIIALKHSPLFVVGKIGVILNCVAFVVLLFLKI